MYPTFKNQIEVNKICLTCGWCCHRLLSYTDDLNMGLLIYWRRTGKVKSTRIVRPNDEFPDGFWRIEMMYKCRKLSVRKDGRSHSPPMHYCSAGNIKPASCCEFPIGITHKHPDYKYIKQHCKIVDMVN